MMRILGLLDLEGPSARAVRHASEARTSRHQTRERRMATSSDDGASGVMSSSRVLRAGANRSERRQDTHASGRVIGIRPVVTNPASRYEIVRAFDAGVGLPRRE